MWQKDRAAIEKIIAEDFHFTSPLDNRLDRETYFRAGQGVLTGLRER